MSIKIITDSAADIDQNEFDDVIVLPMTITIQDVSYRDGIDIDKTEFYEKLAASENLPITSLISPAVFEDTYEEITKAGDEAIVLPLSSELSGTFQSASIAAEDYPNVSVMDTLMVTIAQRILVLRCRDLIHSGLSRLEIVEQLHKDLDRLVAFGAVDTLEYLRKGGRISGSSAIVGGIIGIKPILSIEGGKLIGIGTARGSKKSNQFISGKVRDCGGIDFTMPYSVGYTGNDDTNMMQYLETNKDLLANAPHDVEVVHVGSTVGTHAGPGTVIVAFFRNL